MALLQLNICAIRNIKQASLSFSSTINLFYGNNASGKSAIIEAIFLLGRAKSFRTTATKSLINCNEKQSMVTGVVLLENGNVISMGLQLMDKGCFIHINQQVTCKRSDLAYALPLQIIHPKSYELLDGGSQLRREFLDWGVFNSNPNFLLVWRHFKKALIQRNVALKQKALMQLGVWTTELAYYGSQIAEFRRDYLKKLEPIFVDINRRFLIIDNVVKLKLLSGWDDNVSLSQALLNDWNKDLYRGVSHSGPHRADFQVVLSNGMLAKNYVSRGQLKLLTMSLIFAQIQLLINDGGNPPCILIDDFSAELDIKNQREVLIYLSQINCQVFVTAIDSIDFKALADIEDYKIFHVENDGVMQV